MGFDFTLDGFLHPLGFVTRDPDFPALITDLNRDFFKKAKMLFTDSVNSDLAMTEFAPGRIAHNEFFTESSMGVFVLGRIAVINVHQD
jgi:hypothetical protein